VLILARRFQICNSQIVSILASCGRLSATVPDLANRPRQLVFLTPIDSQLNDFLNEIHQIALLEPSIVECIDEELDLHAKKKKLLRLADAEFLASQTLDLPKLELQLRELQIDKIQLEIGRPRTDAYIVYLFLMLRGFNAGCKDQRARLLLEESITVKLWLEHLGLECRFSRAQHVSMYTTAALDTSVRSKSTGATVASADDPSPCDSRVSPKTCGLLYFSRGPPKASAGVPHLNA
jgi:hypothetical protein